MKTRSIGPIGFIMGGVLVLLSTFYMGDAQTMFPWYIKLAGGIGLIIYGIFAIMQKRNKGKQDNIRG